MKIRLFLVAKHPHQTANVPPQVDGDVLIYDGKSYDLSPLPYGASIDLGWPFTKPVTRSAQGLIELELAYLFDDTDIEPDQSLYEHLRTVDLTSGTFPCPVKRLPKELVNDSTNAS